MRQFAFFGIVVALAVGCHAKSTTTDAGAGAAPASPSASAGKRPTTTSAGIALGNLNADIEVRVANKDPSPDERMRTIELVLARAHFLGKVSDLEQADLLAKAGPEPSFARATVNSAVHRFDAALQELDATKDAPPERIARARATILFARGDYDAALALQPPERERRDPQMIATEAVLAAKMQKTAESDRLFDLARTRIRDVAPFPLAWIDFQRGSLAELAGDDARARTWFAEAVDVLGPYAHAAVHLSVSDKPAAAIARLEAIQKTSDDPEVLAALAAAHTRAGHDDDAKKLLGAARTRYDEVIAKLPEAFADHAARFWLGPGGDPAKALTLARANAKNRPNEEALDLWMAAAAGAKKNDELCAAVAALMKLKYISPREHTLAAAAASKCPASDSGAGP